MKLEILHQTWKENCAYCGVKTKLNTTINEVRIAATRDHFIPLNSGGGRGKKNLVLACRPCNEQKGSFDPHRFIEIWHTIDRQALLAHVARLEAATRPVSIAGRIKAMLRPSRSKKLLKH